MDASGCYIKIRDSLDMLSPAEKRIAGFILDFPDETINMPIEELANRSSTSKSSVVRLCKTLGYKGYKQLCVALAADMALTNRESMNYTDIHPKDSVQSIIRSVCQNNIKTLENSMNVLDIGEMEKAVEAITKAKRVDFYGVGNSGLVAYDAQNKFLRINKVSVTSSDPHLQILSAASLQKEDVAVLISYSGESNDIFDTLNVIKRTGATTIGITRYGSNRLSRMVDIRLQTSSMESFVRSGAMSSRIGQLNIIDMLYTAVASREYSHVKKHLDETMMYTRRKRGGGISWSK